MQKEAGSLAFSGPQARSPDIKSLQKNVFIFMDGGRGKCL
jgi:hypothetical protein